MTRWDQVTLSRTSCGKVTHAATHTTSSIAPKNQPAIRAPNGRQLRGSSIVVGHQSRHAWMSVSRMPAGADVEELVHQALRARPAGTIARTATQPSR